MSETKFTPGPWVIDLDSPMTLGGDARSIEAADHGFVSREICSLLFDTDEHPNGKAYKEDVGNARLISAAPDLFQPCRSLAEIFDGVEDMSELDASFFVDNAGKIFEAAMESRAAIAKATGEKL